MSRLALLFALLALVTTGCGKKKLPPPPPPAASPTPATPPATNPAKARAPAGIPQEFFDLFQEKWPAIEQGGKDFSAKFTEAQTAQRAGDRVKMAAAIEEARTLYQTATDAWAEIAYWHINSLDDGEITQATHDKCERFLRNYEKTVSGWGKKAKALKELSTVK